MYIIDIKPKGLDKIPFTLGKLHYQEPFTWFPDPALQYRDEVAKVAREEFQKHDLAASREMILGEWTAPGYLRIK